jgi:hypothetical protein
MKPFILDSISILTWRVQVPSIDIDATTEFAKPHYWGPFAIAFCCDTASSMFRIFGSSDKPGHIEQK